MIQTDDGFTIIETIGGINNVAEASQELCLELERQALIAGDDVAQAFFSRAANIFCEMRSDHYLRAQWCASREIPWHLTGKSCKSAFETEAIRCSIREYGPAVSEIEALDRWLEVLRHTRFFEFMMAPTAALIGPGEAGWHPHWRYNQPAPPEVEHLEEPTIAENESREMLLAQLRASTDFAEKTFAASAGVTYHQFRDWHRRKAHKDGGAIDRSIRNGAKRWLKAR